MLGTSGSVDERVGGSFAQSTEKDQDRRPQYMQLTSATTTVDTSSTSRSTHSLSVGQGEELGALFLCPPVVGSASVVMYSSRAFLRSVRFTGWGWSVCVAKGYHELCGQAAFLALDL